MVLLLTRWPCILWDEHAVKTIIPCVGSLSLTGYMQWRQENCAYFKTSVMQTLDRSSVPSETSMIRNVASDISHAATLLILSLVKDLHESACLVLLAKHELWVLLYRSHYRCWCISVAPTWCSGPPFVHAHVAVGETAVSSNGEPNIGSIMY